MKKPHYAWVICAAGLWIFVCNMGVNSTLMSVYLPFIEAEGLSHSMGSALLTVKCLFAFLTIFVVGVYYRKFSLRLGILLASLVAAAAPLAYYVGGAPMYFFGASLAGVAYGAGNVFPVSLLLANWFHSRRGLAVGITSAGSGLATTLFSRPVTALITNYSLRTAFLTESVFLAVSAVLVYAVVRDTPEEIGLGSYREKADENPSVKTAAEEEGQAEPLPRSVLWALALMMLLNGGAGFAFSGHLSVLTINCGYSAELAAKTVSTFGLLLLTSKFIAGGIADRIGTLKSSVLLIAVYIGGCFCVMGMNGEAALWCTLLAVFLGFGASVFNVGPPLWAVDLSPRGQYAGTLRWLSLFYNLGGILFTAVPGIIADHTGEYKSAYYMFAAMMSVSLLILCLVYRRRKMLRNTQ